MLSLSKRSEGGRMKVDMRVLIFGGTFDPHRGHAALLLAAAKKYIGQDSDRSRLPGAVKGAPSSSKIVWPWPVRGILNLCRLRWKKSAA